MKRSSRAASSGQRDKAKAFSLLRAGTTSGGNKDYTFAEEDVIFDEVEEAAGLLGGRVVGEDTFVEDDDGMGYADYGQNEWAGGSGSDAEEEVETKESGKGKGKRRAPPSKPKKVAKAQRITTVLARNAKAKALLPVSQAPTVDDDDFMRALLGDVDSGVAEQMAHSTGPGLPRTHGHSRSQPQSVALPHAQRKRLQDMQRIALFGQSTEAASVYGSGISSLAPSASTATTAAALAQPAPDSNPLPDHLNDPSESMDTDIDVAMDLFGEPAIKVKTFGKRVDAPTMGAASFVPTFAPVPAPQSHHPTLHPNPTGQKQKSTVASTSDSAHAQNWKSVQQTIHTTAAPSFEASTVSPSNISPTDILEPDGSLRIYWFDASENKGIVYLFGKVLHKRLNVYLSTCVTVKNIQRNLFILPRAKKLDGNGNPSDEDVTSGDVYTEFDFVRKGHGVTSFRSKEVSRKYCFEIPEIPSESNYLKVVYGYDQPDIPTTLSGQCFSKIFGARTSALEWFILKRNLMGPCWLEIKDPVIGGSVISWCKLEITVNDPKSINPFPETEENAPKDPPPFVVTCFSLKTVMNHRENMNEIVMASMLTMHNVNIDGETKTSNLHVTHNTVIRQLEEIPYPIGFQDAVKKDSGHKVEVLNTERALLSFLLNKLQQADPDVLVGHNFIGFDLDVLLHRLKEHKISGWSKLGRLRRSKWPELQAGAGGMGDTTYAERQVASGRLLCDTYLAAKDLIRSKSYSLTQLALSQLDINRDDCDFEKIPQAFWKTEDLHQIVRHTSFDATLASKLMFKLQILPLTKQLTNLAGNLWSRTMTGARAERNEYLLLHEFHKSKYIVPDKDIKLKTPLASIDANNNNDDDDDPANDQNRNPAAGKGKKVTTRGRRKPAYAGGLVLEPKKGFYDKYVLMLDFNSLYPSIIQEFNIDFTTVKRDYGAADDVMPEVPPPDLERGILPRLLSTLVKRRYQVKNLMKDPKLSPEAMAQYDIRQKGLKLTANSMYGCLGFAHSRFFAKPIAMLITSKGREILQDTVNLAEAEKLEVIYGDTDSIMIYTNTDNLQEVKKIGHDFKKAVNLRYKLLEIEMDGFFQKMLLLKKKKYAALLVKEKDGKIQTVIETKGLDLVRRDWCGLSHDVSTFVLDQIMSGNNREEILEKIHAYLTLVGEETRKGLILIEKFIVNKQLTKPPEAYADAKTQPHVQVAIAMKAKGVGTRAGDTIPYVICAGDATTVTARAHHPDDLKKEDCGLIIDFEWYLSNQVHPPIARLCEHIEGTDTARLASCLGLDTAKYHGNMASAIAADDLYTLESQIPDEERFKNVEKFCPVCIHCQTAAEFEALVHSHGGDLWTSLKCPNLECRKIMPLASLSIQLQRLVYAHIASHETGWLVCDDAACGNKTLQMGSYGRKCLVQGCRGGVLSEYSDAKLDTQLQYLESLFDVERFKRQVEKKPHADALMTIAQQNRREMDSLFTVVNKYARHNDRRWVDLSKLFEFCKV